MHSARVQTRQRALPDEGRGMGAAAWRRGWLDAPASLGLVVWHRGPVVTVEQHGAPSQGALSASPPVVAPESAGTFLLWAQVNR